MQSTAIFRPVSCTNGPTQPTSRAIKFTAIFLTIFCLQISARGYSQQVTISEVQAPLQKVFSQIEQQTGYLFFYNAAWLEKSKPVTIKVKNVDLKKALDICFQNQSLTYTIVGKTVVLKLKTASSISQAGDLSPSSPAPPVNIRGRVIDSIGNSLAGASIKVKSTNVTTHTNQNGEFELDNLLAEDILIISYVGYTTIQQTVPKTSLSLIISLRASNNELDKVLVQAYGTTSRRFSVGSIGTVDAATIGRQPVTNPLLALQGQVAGLTITSSNGAPGSRVYVQVRGQNTFVNPVSGAKAYDQPLFIIDGVPFAPQNNNLNQLSSLSSTSTSGGGLDQAGGISPFNSINPNDIESISVLKDADATSIYGSEGSNGVILITTKRGRSGKTTFNLSANTSFNSTARPVKLLNTQQYLDLRKAAFAAGGLTPGNNPAMGATYAPDLTIYDSTRFTDWQDVIFGKTSNNTDIHATLSGGTGNNTFLISGGYTRSTFNFPGSYSNQRLTLHSVFHRSSTDNRLGVDFITDYGYGQNNSPGFGASQSILLPPNTPELLNSDGSLIWNYKGVNLEATSPPTQFYSYLEQFSDFQNHNFNSSLQVSYKIYKGLTISTNIGYNRNTTSEVFGNPFTAKSSLSPTAAANFANRTVQTINIEPQLNYRATIGRGILSVLAGGTYRKNAGNSTFITGTGYTNDNLLRSINGAVTKAVTDANNIRKYGAGFGRISYNYAQRYIVQLTGRRDGSSNFGPGNQFGNFGSVGAGWIFSEENGLKKSVPFISYGKLSANYGTSGSDGVEPYRFQTFWAPLGTTPAFQGIQPTFPQNHSNPDYSWAVKKSLNISLDLGFFQDRVLLNTTFYRNREGNQLASYPLPIQTGFTSVTQNLTANIQNKGWEFSLNTKNIQSKYFSWESNFNISFNRNKLLSFPNLATSTYRNSYLIGEPISVILAFKYAGIDPATGLPQFYDKNGTITSSPVAGILASGGDWAPVANRDVAYMGGLNNALSYKQFRLNFFLQFAAQTAPNYLGTLYRTNRIGITQQNVPLAVLNKYWVNPKDQAQLPKLTTSPSSPVSQANANFLTSSALYEKNRYLRLKNVSLSYNLPQSLIKKLHMNGGSINLNAQNVLTFTNVEVGDPESFGNYASFPLQRIVALGINLNF